MKIKKSFLAILAVLTLFGASVSTSISSFTSVEANAATHHKNDKKHKKSKKTSKKHKKSTKKGKKKATKKHKKVTKKHSKKKNTHKKTTHKKNTPKKTSKKKRGNRPTPKPKTPHVTKHVRATNTKPTISINDGSGSVNVAYSSVQDKSYDNVDINNVTSSYPNHDVKLRGISYYKLTGNDKFKTAVTLKLQFFNNNSDDQDFASHDDTYLVNSDGIRLYPALGSYESAIRNVASNTNQFVNLTFYSSQDLPLSSFSTFNLVYDVSGRNFGTTINY